PFQLRLARQLDALFPHLPGPAARWLPLFSAVRAPLAAPQSRQCEPCPPLPFGGQLRRPLAELRPSCARLQLLRPPHRGEPVRLLGGVALRRPHRLALWLPVLRRRACRQQLSRWLPPRPSV